MPDLSSSPSPSAIIRSYCCFGRARERQIEPGVFCEVQGDPAVLGRVRGGEETGVIAVLHVFAIGLENARVGAGLGENFAQHGEIKPERGTEAEAFREPGGVDVHDHVDERLHFRGLAGLPM